MKLHPTWIHGLVFCVLSLGISCTKPVDDQNAAGTAPTLDSQPAAEEASPQESWWHQLNALCGNAFNGQLTSRDSVDAEFANQAMTMHVRHCETNRLEIPFHIGTNRSRTWILTRTDQGLQLQHDHRHEDGSPDAVTLYGGHTSSPGTAVVQQFPADDFSKQLFEANELQASVVNVWSMEIIPGKTFSYTLRRPERHFQVDFDLTQVVDTPPAPWGHGDERQLRGPGRLTQAAEPNLDCVL